MAANLRDRFLMYNQSIANKLQLSSGTLLFVRATGNIAEGWR